MENIPKPSNKTPIIIILLALAILGFMFLKPKAITPNENINVVPTVMGNAGDLVSFSVAPGGVVSGPMVLTGSVKNAYFFEANILVKIKDVNLNTLLSTNGTATTDWMTVNPVSFTSNVNFTGLPLGPAYIVLENDNPSDDPNLSKQIIIPIVIN